MLASADGRGSDDGDMDDDGSTEPSPLNTEPALAALAASAPACPVDTGADDDGA